MSSDTDDLRELFVEVTDEETVTEQRREGPSRDPIEEDDAEIVAAATEDGLDDAVAGFDVSGDDAAAAN